MYRDLVPRRLRSGGRSEHLADTILVTHDRDHIPVRVEDDSAIGGDEVTVRVEDGTIAAPENGTEPA